jgi:opacity protein-like surface antigen
LGIDAGTFMPYVTAGLAFANATATDEYYDYEDTQTHVGWTAGVGVEIAASENMSIDLQYRYNDFGSADYDLYDTASLSLTSQQVTAGLHFRF